jgi:hypothetical protein
MIELEGELVLQQNLLDDHNDLQHIHRYDHDYFHHLLHLSSHFSSQDFLPHSILYFNYH